MKDKHSCIALQSIIRDHHFAYKLAMNFLEVVPPDVTVIFIDSKILVTSKINIVNTDTFHRLRSKGEIMTDIDIVEPESYTITPGIAEREHTVMCPIRTFTKAIGREKNFVKEKLFPYAQLEFFFSSREIHTVCKRLTKIFFRQLFTERTNFQQTKFLATYLETGHRTLQLDNPPVVTPFCDTDEYITGVETVKLMHLVFVEERTVHFQILVATGSFVENADTFRSRLIGCKIIAHIDITEEEHGLLCNRGIKDISRALGKNLAINPIKITGTEEHAVS